MRKPLIYNGFPLGHGVSAKQRHGLSPGFGSGKVSGKGADTNDSRRTGEEDSGMSSERINGKGVLYAGGNPVPDISDMGQAKTKAAWRDCREQDI